MRRRRTVKGRMRRMRMRMRTGAKMRWLAWERMRKMKKTR